jgi:hypothetical protein
MSDFWSDFPDETLSPLDLAEKKWALASEESQETDNRYAQVLSIQSRVAPHTLDGAIRQQNAIATVTQEREEQKKRVRTLWLQWVALKPYVSKEMKVRLGCDPACTS